MVKDISIYMETKFNFNSQVCTSRSQSEKLLALGLKKETADMHWFYTGKIHGWQHCSSETYIEAISHPFKKEWATNGVIQPAWSLHRLLSLLPDYIVVNSSSGLNPNFYLNIRDGFVSYKDNRGFSYSSTSGNMYDAITRMISFLIKEGYFNKEYLV